MTTKLNQLLAALMLLGGVMLLPACGGDDDPVAPEPIEVAFSGTTVSISEAATSGTTLTLLFSSPLPAAGTFSVAVTSEPAITLSDYVTTDPALSGNTLQLSLDEGTESTTITVTPVDNAEFTGDITLTFTITEAPEGIDIPTTGNTVFTVTITDNEAPRTGLPLPYEQGFNNGLAEMDMQIVNISGSVTWEGTTVGDNRGITGTAGDDAIQIDAFGDDAPSEDWLITPLLDISEAAKLSFYSLVRFSDSQDEFLEIFISTDYDPAMFTPETPNLADFTWTELPEASAAVEADGEFDFDYTFSGEIGIPDQYVGEVVALAFRYTSTGTGGGEVAFTRIDEVVVEAGIPATLTINDGSFTGDFGAVNNGETSAPQTIDLVGSGLAELVTVSTTGAFEVSTDGASWSTSVEVAAAAVNATQTISVRFAPTSGFNGAAEGTLDITTPEAAGASYVLTGEETGNVVVPLRFQEDFVYGDQAGDITTLSSDVWTVHSGSADFPQFTPTPNLTYANYAAGTGTGGHLSAAYGSGRADVSRSFGTIAEGETLYVAFLVNFTTVAGDDGEYFFHLRPEDGAFRGRVYMKTGVGTDSYQLGVSKADNGAVVYLDQDINGTALVVLEYEVVAGADNDAVRLHVFHAGEEFPATRPTPDAVATDTQTDQAVSLAAIRQGGSTGPTFLLDGIIATTDWADLVVN